MTSAQAADALRALDRSVVADDRDRPLTTAAGIYGIWLGAAYQDGIPPWGSNIWLRDRLLRRFITEEHFFASAMGIVAARNAALSWNLTGTRPRLIDGAQQMLNNVNFGGGWDEFIVQTTIDLSTQDQGAFIEIVRESDDPRSPCIGLNHLDAALCYPTGNPETPVIYQDTLGEWHEMKWYQVYRLLEMPSPITPLDVGYFGRIQYSTLTRVLRAAKTMQSIWIYNDEKAGGRFTRSVHFVNGIGEKQLQDALARAALSNDDEGLRRYSPGLLVTTLNPDARPTVASIELASLPSGWDEEKAIKHYITALSMAFMTDYQEFAPLPGGGLGTSAQSEILDKKSRGKGPALFQSMMTRLMNHAGILPRGVEFNFNEPNPDAARDDAELQKVRAEAAEINIRSGVWTPGFARQIQLDDGSITEEQYDVLAAETGTTDQTNTIVVQDDEAPGSVQPEMVKALRALAIEGAKAAGPTVSFGPLLNGRLHRAYAETADDLGSLGYFRSLDDRLAVASAVGPALAVMEESLRGAGLWELQIGADDADAIVERAWKQLSMDPNPADMPDVSDEDERLSIEREVADDAQAGLLVLRRNIRRRLNELA